MPVKDQKEKYEITLGVLKDAVRTDPTMTAARLVEVIETAIANMERATLRTTCRNCGQPITLVNEDQGWYHADAYRSRGCRAASYTESSGYTQGLSKSATAKPPAGYQS